MRINSRRFETIRSMIDTVPVVDCHEHMQGPRFVPNTTEPVAAIMRGYILSDLQSAGFGVSDREVQMIADDSVSTDAKWPLFERLWKATEHTAYARVSKNVLRDVYGVSVLTRESLDTVAARLEARNEERYMATLDDAGISVILTDVLGWLAGGMRAFLDGSFTFPGKFRPLISLPMFHPTTFNRETIDFVAGLVEGNITSLEGYLEAVHEIMRRCTERGAIGIKDQAAYGRTIAYDLVDRCDAEGLFNRALSDPNNSVGWPDGKPLNDYLFHRFMEFAAEFDLPVQLHTGHMAGIRNRIGKTNAVNLSTVLDVHRAVQFDLFHGNWPYLGEVLFLGKNYPNVSIDLCWLHIIDPRYAVDLLERGTYTFPHTKIHGFGGDYGDFPEFVAGHLSVARDNIAAALTSLIESAWIDEEEATRLAKAWLFENPNRFFRLGLGE